MKNRSILNHALKTCKSLTMNSRQMGQVRGPSIIFLPLKAEEVRKKEGKKRDREGCGSKSVRARMITSLFHDKKTKKKKKKSCPTTVWPYQSMQVDMWLQLSITQLSEASRQILHRLSSPLFEESMPYVDEAEVGDFFPLSFRAATAAASISSFIFCSACSAFVSDIS